MHGLQFVNARCAPIHKPYVLYERPKSCDIPAHRFFMKEEIARKMKSNLREKLRKIF